MKREVRIDHLICEDVEEKKKRLNGLKCDKLVITFQYFIDYDLSGNEERKKNIKIKYFDSNDLKIITQNENIYEIEYKFQNGLYGLIDSVLSIIFQGVQPVLSFTFSKSYHFKGLEEYISMNTRCRIMKFNGAHYDYNSYAGKYYWGQCLLEKNNTLLEIEGLDLKISDKDTLNRNKGYFVNTKKRALTENVKKVFELQKIFKFPKDIFVLLVKKADEEYPIFNPEDAWAKPTSGSFASASV